MTTGGIRLEFPFPTQLLEALKPMTRLNWADFSGANSAVQRLWLNMPDEALDVSNVLNRIPQGLAVLVLDFSMVPAVKEMTWLIDLLRPGTNSAQWMLILTTQKADDSSSQMTVLQSFQLDEKAGESLAVMRHLLDQPWYATQAVSAITSRVQRFLPSLEMDPDQLAFSIGPGLQANVVKVRPPLPLTRRDSGTESDEDEDEPLPTLNFPLLDLLESLWMRHGLRTLYLHIPDLQLTWETYVALVHTFIESLRQPQSMESVQLKGPASLAGLSLLHPCLNLPENQINLNIPHGRLDILIGAAANIGQPQLPGGTRLCFAKKQNQDTKVLHHLQLLLPENLFQDPDMEFFREVLHAHFWGQHVTGASGNRCPALFRQSLASNPSDLPRPVPSSKRQRRNEPSDPPPPTAGTVESTQPAAHVPI